VRILFKKEAKEVFKNIAMVIMAVVVTGFAVVATSCAKPTTTTPTPPASASTPPASLSTPSASPSTPEEVGTASTTVKGPSWGESNTYTNDQYDFSFQYPKSWVEVDPVNDMVFYVRADSSSGADGANATVVDLADDFAAAVKASYDNDPTLKGLGVQVKVESSRTTTLADGKTTAYEAIVSAKIMGKYDFYGYAFGANKDGKTIFMKGNTLRGASNRALVGEIAQTLVFK
jgi:hypothetical protein